MDESDKYYQYVKYDAAGRPVLSVCLIHAPEGVYSRGVALCHDKDLGKLRKITGSKLARTRAESAVGLMRDGVVESKGAFKSPEALQKLHTVLGDGYYLMAHKVQPASYVSLEEIAYIVSVDKARQEHRLKMQEGV